VILGLCFFALRFVAGELSMCYLCVAFTVGWLIYFAYLFYLDTQLRGIRRRLDARQND